MRNVQITKKSWKGQMCFHSMCVIMCVVAPTCWMLIINIMCVAALPALTPCCHGRWLCSDWLSSVTREERKNNRSKYFHFTSATACNFKNPRRCLLRALRVRFDCTAVAFICTGLHSLHGFKKQNQDQVHQAPVNSGQNTVCSKHSRLSMRDRWSIHTCTTQITQLSNFTFKTSTKKTQSYWSVAQINLSQWCFIEI